MWKELSNTIINTKLRCHCLQIGSHSPHQNHHQGSPALGFWVVPSCPPRLTSTELASTLRSSGSQDMISAHPAPLPEMSLCRLHSPIIYNTC